MATRQQVRDTIIENDNNYFELWRSIDDPRERTSATRELYAIRANFIKSLDPGLKKTFDDAMTFMKDNHSYVFWSSSWSNCTDFMDLLGRYHGVSKWSHKNCKDIDMNEEFKPANISPKQMILDGFESFQVRLNYMRDVQAAGDVDTTPIDDHEKMILDFVADVISRNEDLSLA